MNNEQLKALDTLPLDKIKKLAQESRDQILDLRIYLAECETDLASLNDAKELYEEGIIDEKEYDKVAQSIKQGIEQRTKKLNNKNND